MSEELLVHLKYCLTPTNRINNAAIVISDGHVLALGGYTAFTQTASYRVIDMPDCHAIPGFIDTHIYGAGGFDSMHADTNCNIADMSSLLAKHGVTSFIPTTQSADRHKLIAVVKALADVCHNPMPGAIPVGIHIEGPYLSIAKRGAHPENHIRPINLKEAEEIIESGNSLIKIFTFAPELNGAAELIELLVKNDIVPSMGHTVANQEQVMAAINAGASRCSHLFNGMEPLRQRKVGLAATAMTDERLWVELIVDGVHIHPRMIDLACRCIAKDKLVCISNSVEAAGLDQEGIFQLGEEQILVEKGRTRSVDGVIAGSIEFLDQNFRHLLAYSHLTDAEAAACFTLNAAKSVGLLDRGELKPGKRADLVIMNQSHEVLMTIVAGEIVYRSKELR